MCQGNVKGFLWNPDWVYLGYSELDLNLRIKPLRRLKREAPAQLPVQTSFNQSGSMDFMHDPLSDGAAVSVYSTSLTFSTETLGTEFDLSLPSAHVIRSLERVIEWRGKIGGYSQ